MTPRHPAQRRNADTPAAVGSSSEATRKELVQGRRDRVRLNPEPTSPRRIPPCGAGIARNGFIFPKLKSGCYAGDCTDLGGAVACRVAAKGASDAAWVCRHRHDGDADRRLSDRRRSSPDRLRRPPRGDCRIGRARRRRRRQSAYGGRASEIVFTSLPGPDEMEPAVLDPSTGILAGLRAGGGYIDLTTNAPMVSRRVAEACRTRDIDMLDAPVSGRPPGMTVMVGGAEPVFAKYRPLFEAIAGKIFLCRRRRCRLHRQTRHPVSRLHQFCRRPRRAVDRRQGRGRSRRAGADRAVQRRGQPHLRQHPALGIDRGLYRRRHPRHRRQGSAPRLRARARGRRALQISACSPTTYFTAPRPRAGARTASRSLPASWRQWPAASCVRNPVTIR